MAMNIFGSLEEVNAKKLSVTGNLEEVVGDA